MVCFLILLDYRILFSGPEIPSHPLVHTHTHTHTHTEEPIYSSLAIFLFSDPVLCSLLPVLSNALELWDAQQL